MNDKASERQDSHNANGRYVWLRAYRHSPYWHLRTPAPVQRPAAASPQSSHASQGDPSRPASILSPIALQTMSGTNPLSGLERIQFVSDPSRGLVASIAPEEPGSDLPDPLPSNNIPPSDAQLLGQDDSAAVYVPAGTVNDQIGILLPDVEAGGQRIIDNFDGDNGILAGWFGQNKITDFKAYVRDNPNGGAYHYMPGFGPDNIVLGDGKESNGNIDSEGLMVAEAVESYEDHTPNWDPTTTSGEALSRAMAFSLDPNLPSAGFDTANYWWTATKDGTGKVVHGAGLDYINGNPDYNPQDPNSGTPTQGTDRNPYGNGAGTLFLFWLHSTGYSWNQIVHAQGNTLGEKYKSLTGEDGHQGFEAFMYDLGQYQDANGNLVLPANDDPFEQNPVDHSFNLPGQATPEPVPTPIGG